MNYIYEYFDNQELFPKNSRIHAAIMNYRNQRIAKYGDFDVLLDCCRNEKNRMNLEYWFGLVLEMIFFF